MSKLNTVDEEAHRSGGIDILNQKFCVLRGVELALNIEQLLRNSHYYCGRVIEAELLDLPWAIQRASVLAICWDV
jgi:hypothetical protein